MDAPVSDKGTKALTAASYQALMDSLGAAETARMEFKGDEGRPLNIKRNVLMVPPASNVAATTLLTAERPEDGKPNPHKGVFTLRVDTRLRSRTAWFLLDTTKTVKPFIYQERKAPVSVRQADPQAGDGFGRKKFWFGPLLTTGQSLGGVSGTLLN